jgi:hypothetical protein
MHNSNLIRLHFRANQQRRSIQSLLRYCVRECPPIPELNLFRGSVYRSGHPSPLNPPPSVSYVFCVTVFIIRNSYITRRLGVTLRAKTCPRSRNCRPEHTIHEVINNPLPNRLLRIIDCQEALALILVLFFFLERVPVNSGIASSSIPIPGR